MKKPAYLTVVIFRFTAMATLAFGVQNQQVDNTLQNFHSLRC